jgi:hypothetical protein
MLFNNRREKTLHLTMLMTYDNQKEITIRLSKRELGLLNYVTRGLYRRIDSDVTEWGSSCTGHDVIEHDNFGKDAIVGAYKEIKNAVDSFYTDENQLELPKDSRGNRNPSWV